MGGRGGLPCTSLTGVSQRGPGDCPEPGGPHRASSFLRRTDFFYFNAFFNASFFFFLSTFFFYVFLFLSPYFLVNAWHHCIGAGMGGRGCPFPVSALGTFLGLRGRFRHWPVSADAGPGFSPGRRTGRDVRRPDQARGCRVRSRCRSEVTVTTPWAP